MRLSPFALFMGLSALVKASGETLVTRESDDWEEQEPLVPTVFNGVTVPPMLELDPSNYKDEIAKSKYLVIKHYR
jgi:protein disulfide-isomerase